MPTAKEIAELRRDFFEASEAFEARKAKLLDEAIKEGKAGKILPDSEEAKRVGEFRSKVLPVLQAEQAVKQQKRDELENRRRESKDFVLSAEAEKHVRKPRDPNKEMTAREVAIKTRLSMWKPERLQPIDATTQTLEDTRWFRQY